MSPSDHQFAQASSTSQQQDQDNCLADVSQELPVPGTSNNHDVAALGNRTEQLQ